MKTLFPILLFLFISISPAFSQESWLPVGEGLPGQVHMATAGNGDLYALHYTDSGLQISKWNEVSWTPVTESSLSFYPSSFKVYKGDLYAGGWMQNFNGIPGTRGIARWDGTSWQSVGGGISDGNAVYDMVEYRGELYCTGRFISMGGIQVNHIARWDGTRWHPVGEGFTAPANMEIVGSKLGVYAGDLYVSQIRSRNDTIADTLARIQLPETIMRWNGKSWSAAGNLAPVQVHHMIAYKGYLYARGIMDTVEPNSLDIARWNGTKWEILPPPKYMGINSWEVYNGEIYVGGWGRDTIAARFDGTRWEPILSAPRSTIATMTLCRGQLYVGGVFRTPDGEPDPLLNHITRLCDATNCGMISGTVYHDSDDDCIIDGNGADPPLTRRIVKVTPGPYYVTSKADGSYAQYLPFGTYNVTLTPREYWNQLCPMASDGYDVTLAAGDHIKEKNFGLQPVPNVMDVRVSVVAGRARPGMGLTYAISYENVGTVPANGTIRFQHDPILTFVASAPPQARSAGNIIEWDFTNLAVDESRTINVTMRVPQSTAVGTKLCGSVEVDLDRPDLRIHHRDTFCIDVTGSYDPNDISVAPFGIEKNGEITREDSILAYTVRFQNTGNDTAFKVVVVDTLSAHLDAASIIPGAASHPFSFTIDGKGILTWTFDYILLPDSGASEPNSHGFFKYTIHQRRHLPLGTEIPNRVDIYFDYNAPVATNTVVSIIGESSSVPLSVDPVDVTVYPNPAKEALHLRGMLGGDERVELRDLLGNRVEAGVEWMGAEAMIDLRGVASGTYFVAIATKQGTMLRRVTVAR